MGGSFHLEMLLVSNLQCVSVHPATQELCCLQLNELFAYTAFGLDSL